MADRLDVAERLAEGRPAVEHTQSYVSACQRVGYEHPELTAQAAQIRDWYDTEEGLDLYALDADCAALRAAGTAVAEALRMQRAQVAELATAWTGPGADGAVGFLRRHCDAADAVVNELRAAAQRCESLRDSLWRLVDCKVAAAVAIDDRTLAARPGWLAAATAVTTGVGDRPTAEDVVRQQIEPYVDNDVRDDWLTAMQSTRDRVAESYDMVIDRLATAPRAYFEVPGDLGPGRHAVQPATPAPAPVPPDAAAPALTPALTPATALTPMAPSPADLAAALGSGPAIPTGSGGSGDFGGLGALAGRIVEAMGGLLGSAADRFGDASFGQDVADGHADDADDAKLEKPNEAEKAAEETAERDRDEPQSGEQIRDVAEKAATPPVSPPSAPPVSAPPPATVPPPSAGEPPPAAEPRPAAGPSSPPAPVGSTPCEIAADELPKAGQ
ncbi:hypothetical protein H7H78_18565 [Mycobacterium shinjukuense]|uniref:Uncharacterized protein n=1 Tax=Mycobacterium shinjukuense TaxID=398694 RepID=A0A7I7MS16_9MYCO|nr:hypothetical protein [Mycobacterium shinjukuense]MCV6987335.1 hypothetical protein [Mycobacterium shinjukuense]ORB72007.1 hypothetical protein BST45_01040 [Mycobacterium shinjukuense]BBX74760.1 hypothetical protein MSHI_26660 [Mycobacterium shinjukuense]